jgi:hypothetical protein
MNKVLFMLVALLITVNIRAVRIKKYATVEFDVANQKQIPLFGAENKIVLLKILTKNKNGVFLKIHCNTVKPTDASFILH